MEQVPTEDTSCRRLTGMKQFVAIRPNLHRLVQQRVVAKLFELIRTNIRNSNPWNGREQFIKPAIGHSRRYSPEHPYFVLARICEMLRIRQHPHPVSNTARLDRGANYCLLHLALSPTVTTRLSGGQAAYCCGSGR